GEDRSLTRQVLGVPLEDVPEQGGGFVVEVVAHHQDVVVALPGDLVQEVALRQPTSGAGGAGGGSSRLGHREPDVGGEVDDLQLEVAGLGEVLRDAQAVRGVLPDQEEKVHAGDEVATLGQDVTEDEDAHDAGDA